MKNLTQKQAHEILVKNNHLCGGNVPFDKTVNYTGILTETNAHRKLHNAQPLK